MVSLTIGSLTGENRLSITNAPSYVLDAITDNGYYLKAESHVLHQHAAHGPLRRCHHAASSWMSSYS